MAINPVLHLVAGPNGSGKSTFVELVLAPTTSLPFVNADLIATEIWPGDEERHGHAAARLAGAKRNDLLMRGSSFIAETVFSHPSKIELIEQALRLGYLVEFHVIMIPRTIPVLRVESRVAKGGHNVPRDKILTRFERLWPLVAIGRNLADRATFYDNSQASTPFRVVARYQGGNVIGIPDWPNWTDSSLL
jgi:predicted ABC-type ATPase